MIAQPPFRLPPSGVLYHYTTRALAQEMSMAGRILPGRSGVIYLTDVLYTLGWQATDHLALPDKNAEVAIPVPRDVLLEDPEYRGVVPEWPTGSGRSFRRGGGHQWTVGQPIPLRVFPWSWIELGVP